MKVRYVIRYIQLGANIAYYRKIKGYTQFELAERVDIEQTHMSKTELAKVGISMDVLFRISDILEIAPKKLLEFRE